MSCRSDTSRRRLAGLGGYSRLIQGGWDVLKESSLHLLHVGGSRDAVKWNLRG